MHCISKKTGRTRLITRAIALSMAPLLLISLFCGVLTIGIDATNINSDGSVTASADITEIVSVVPYFEVSGGAQPTASQISSREDIRLNPSSTFLMIKINVSSVDAQKYLDSQISLFKLRPHQSERDLTGIEPITSFTVQKSGMFEQNIRVTADFSKLENGEIFYKYAIAVKDGDGYTALSDSRYIDNINCLSDKKDVPPETVTKKGLQVQMLGEAKQLGVRQASVYFRLNDIVASSQDANTLTYQYEGEDYYFNKEKMAEIDGKIKYLTNEGANVAGVILLEARPELFTSQVEGAQSSPLTHLLHPNATAAMKDFDNAKSFGLNMKTADGVRHFSAVMSFIADRYVRDDTGFGRLYNIILGDEIGRASVRNNCGEMEINEYAQNYMTALRICDTAIRSRFGGARVYVPFDKYFASKPEGDTDYINRDLIDKLLELSVKEGNIPWNAAIHPYNVDLSRADFWNETEPDGTYNTPMVTMKNIEVFCDYFNAVKGVYNKDGERRKVLISDLGYSSEDNSTENMVLQAAAYVYAYMKVRSISDISGFIYHRHVDSTNERGSYGLWTLNEDVPQIQGASAPRDKKKIYDVFKYMDTNKEEASIEFVKSVIGIESFTEISPGYNVESPTYVLNETVSETVKAKLTSTRISRFDTVDLSGFLNNSGIGAPKLFKYEKEGSEFDTLNLLSIKFSNTQKGDYDGIFKNYIKGAELDLSSQKYVNIKFRIDTEENVEEIPVLLILEGSPSEQESNQATSANGVVTSGTIQNVTVEDKNKTLYIYEGAANVRPNEDIDLYFDIGEWEQRGKITRIEFLVNPHVFSTDSDGYMLYISSLNAARKAKFSIIMLLVQIVLFTVLILAVTFAVLVIRARIITNRRKKRRAELLRRKRLLQQRRGGAGDAVRRRNK